jgi:hypothetical protein
MVILLLVVVLVEVREGTLWPMAEAELPVKGIKVVTVLYRELVCLRVVAVVKVLPEKMQRLLKQVTVETA